MNLGDIAAAQVLYFHFTTRQFSTGIPITSASLAVSVYKDDSTTQSTSGITTTFTTGFDGVAGLVSVKIDTSSDGTFYAAGHDFSVIVTAGTADSVSIIGEVVGYFSIANRSALRSSQITLSGGAVTVGTNNDKTGYTASTVSDKTGYSLSTGGVQAIWDALTSALSTASSIGKLLVDNVNATISSRSTYAGADTSGTTTLLTRIASALTITTGKVDVNDKTGFALTSAYDPAKTASQAGDVMKLSSGTGANQIDLASGLVNIGKINSATVTGDGTSGDKWRAL